MVDRAAFVWYMEQAIFLSLDKEQPVQLRDFVFENATLIQRTQDGTTSGGAILYGGVNGDGSIGIGWLSRSGGDQTSHFRIHQWKITAEADSISLERITENAGEADDPPSDAVFFRVVPWYGPASCLPP